MTMRTLRCRCTLLLVMSTVVGAVVAAASNAQSDDAWRVRLEALEPQHPMAYFELAEEIADVARTSEDRALARRLFALAGLLDRQRLGHSACLALADLAERPTERRRLLALASLLGNDRIGPPLLDTMQERSIANASTSTILDLLEAFSHYRRGRGQDALEALRRPGVRDLLEQLGTHLRGGVAGFIEDCNMYRGDLRPSLARDDLNRMLRLEIALLSGTQRPWSADLLLSQGQPMIEVDPGDLAAAFDHDASQPYFRDGRWVSKRTTAEASP